MQRHAELRIKCSGAHAARVLSRQSSATRTQLLPPAGGRLKFWSPGASRMFGYAAHQTVRRFVDCVIPGLSKRSLVPIHLRHSNPRKPLWPGRSCVRPGTGQRAATQFCRIHLVTLRDRAAGWLQREIFRHPAKHVVEVCGWRRQLKDGSCCEVALTVSPFSEGV
jgi:hypothetical protein